MNVFTQLRGMASTGNNICQTLFQGHVMWRWVYQNHDVYNCVAPLQTKSTKSLPYRFLGVKRNSNATSEYLGFLPLLLQYCCWQSFVNQFQNTVYNLQMFKTYHAFTFVKRTPKAELLIYSIVHAVYTFLFLAPMVRPDFHSCDHVHAAALPQHVVNTGHQRFLSNDPKMQIFCSEEFSCPAVRYLTPGDACIQ